ncbi:unnamed protein product (macronuclear) [Paramecium tetraurelia]|uniref:Carbonic anhydrase n=1 Tax=Paramecium tetraurelia TaxID=5888 RepID=A0CZ78_PARTE|nr:uncharacterized protein GSPATT00011668001 [Paramecium tetraurelia]CAK76095.1 unnamed protein product [Paramecium tetraurelia]|eukprot:XP_001443492.1 hypothetical protein (macronuclear) [Paramecium tetraurelia strain d4-2]
MNDQIRWQHYKHKLMNNKTSDAQILYYRINQLKSVISNLCLIQVFNIYLTISMQNKLIGCQMKRIENCFPLQIKFTLINFQHLLKQRIEKPIICMFNDKYMKFLKIGIIILWNVRKRLKYCIQIKHFIDFFWRILQVRMITTFWYFDLRRYKPITRFKSRLHSLCFKIFILMFKNNFKKYILNSNFIFNEFNNFDLNQFIRVKPVKTFRNFIFYNIKYYVKKYLLMQEQNNNTSEKQEFISSDLTYEFYKLHLNIQKIQIIMQNQVVQNGISEIQKYTKAILGNKNYVAKKLAEDPDYFSKLAKGQNPKYLLIGCSDSRAPPNELTETDPGEIFIHRNIANVVNMTDLNLNCVVQYAVEHLKVHNIIIMGHTFCGGVKAAMNQDSVGGLLDLWLNNIKHVYEKNQHLVNQFQDENDRVACLSCLNVREQVLNMWKNPIVQKSWQDGHPVMIHGWLFRVETGYIEELQIDESIPENLSNVFRLQFKNAQQAAKAQQQDDKGDNNEKNVPSSNSEKYQQMQNKLESEFRKLSPNSQDSNQEPQKNMVSQISGLLQEDPNFKQENI